MTQTVFIRLDTLSARASQDDTALPSLALTLCADEKVDFAFITAADAVAPLDGTGIVVKCVVKARPDNATALLLDVSCDYNGEAAAAARYSAQWTADTLDGPALRDFLGSDISRAGDDHCGPWMEVAWTIDGVTQRCAFPITIRNAWLRPEDTAPDPRTAAADEWLTNRSPRMDIASALSADQRAQLLTNIGNTMQMRLSDDADYVHIFTPLGIYKGSMPLLDLGIANL